ncbi:MAG: hypothetical protein KA175_11095, partial [Flavobacteriales bacterium]|nr:hypothetical protein [Flavobacteriales bacterium]
MRVPSGLRFAFVSSAFVLSCVLSAQNVVVSGALSGNGSYTTLRAAFVALNGGAQTGSTIMVNINASTTETQPAVLNAGTWTSVLIKPNGGAARTITGQLAGAPVIDLSGADLVTIDGLNSAGNALTISNTSNASTANTAAIRLVNDASNNLITRCSLRGSSTQVSNGLSATVMIMGGISSGNDGNTISLCDLGPTAAGLAQHHVFAQGSTGTAAIFNSGVTVTQCNIFDYFADGTSSTGILVSVGNTDWTISNNRLYQTASRTYNGGNNGDHHGILVGTTGNNFQITGNTIGYASSTGTGVYAINSNAYSNPIVKGIEIFEVGTTVASNISSNTIAGYNIYARPFYANAAGPFVGIFIRLGLAVCNGNTIGSLTTTGSISVTSNSPDVSDVLGIICNSTSPFTSNNNNIGGITLCQVGTSHLRFTALQASLGNWTATGNTIGGTMDGSITNVSTSLETYMSGIKVNGGSATLTGNVIRNMSAAVPASTGVNASVIGILVLAGNHFVAGNTIHGLRNTHTADVNPKEVIGICYRSGTGGNGVSENLIYNLNVSSDAGSIVGIDVPQGSSTVSNNMIALGHSVSVGAVIVGIRESTSSVHSAFHNSVYIAGTALTGSSGSFGLSGASGTGFKNYRNNILVNARSSGGSTGSHFAITLPSGSTTGLDCNNNLLLATGNSGSLGRYALVAYKTMQQWRTATNRDQASVSGDARFVAPTASVPDLHIAASPASFAEGQGVNASTVAQDFDGQTRSGLTPTDIGADAGNFTARAQCGGTPPAGTISGQSNVCANAGRELSFSNGSTDLGLSYQWRSSTAPGGPFNTVLGTDIVQNTGVQAVTTYYQVTTTCSSGGGTNVTTPFAVTVTPLPVATAANNGPTCTNTAAQLTGTSTTGLTHAWTGPNNFSSAALSPAVPAVQLAADGVYTLITTTADGCASVPATTTLVVKPGPIMSYTGVSPTPTCLNGNAQLNANAATYTPAKQLTFTAATGTLDPMSGAITALSTPNSTAPSAPLNIGFAFPFNATTYTQFSVSPSGWMLLGGGTATTQTFASVQSSTNTPKIYPFWSDIMLGANGNVKYVVTGSAPNRILKVQWFVPLPGYIQNFAANATFQAWLYEADGRIDFRYGAMPNPEADVIAVGITVDFSNFQSITIVGGTVSTTVPNNDNFSSPTNGTRYTFSASPVTYAWSPNTFLNNANLQNPTASNINMPSQAYTVTATNALGCSTTGNATITTQGISVATITGSLYVCGAGNTTLTAVGQGGLGPYTYLWNAGAQTTASIATDTAGTFNCTVTDACGLQAVANANVTFSSVGNACNDGDPNTFNDVLVAPYTCQG